MWVCDCYLQCIEVGQPHTVPPTQIPSKMVMTDINGLQVPCLIPEEIQDINGLEENTQEHNSQFLLCLTEQCSKQTFHFIDSGRSKRFTEESDTSKCFLKWTWWNILFWQLQSSQSKPLDNFKSTVTQNVCECERLHIFICISYL